MDYSVFVVLTFPPPPSSPNTICAFANLFYNYMRKSESQGIFPLILSHYNHYKYLVYNKIRDLYKTNRGCATTHSFFRKIEKHQYDCSAI